jgi:hypothetical protein
MDRVQAECRKCGYEFSTAAATRTTCPRCKGAVSVRRDSWSGEEPYERRAEGEINAVSLLVVLGVAGTSWIGRKLWERWMRRDQP